MALTISGCLYLGGVILTIADFPIQTGREIDGNALGIAAIILRHYLEEIDVAVEQFSIFARATNPDCKSGVAAICPIPIILRIMVTEISCPIVTSTT